MTKATIRGNLSKFIPDIAVTHEKGLDYVLGETNSYSCHVSEHRKPRIVLLIMCDRVPLASAIRQEPLYGRWITSYSRMSWPLLKHPLVLSRI